MDMKQYLNPARNKDESFEAYKVRRCSANFHVQAVLKGKVIYSSLIPFVKEKKQ